MIYFLLCFVRLCSPQAVASAGAPHLLVGGGGGRGVSAGRLARRVALPLPAQHDGLLHHHHPRLPAHQVLQAHQLPGHGLAAPYRSLVLSTLISVHFFFKQMVQQLLHHRNIFVWLKEKDLAPSCFFFSNKLK